MTRENKEEFNIEKFTLEKLNNDMNRGGVAPSIEINKYKAVELSLLTNKNDSRNMISHKDLEYIFGKAAQIDTGSGRGYDIFSANKEAKYMLIGSGFKLNEIAFKELAKKMAEACKDKSYFANYDSIYEYFGIERAKKEWTNKVEDKKVI